LGTGDLLRERGDLEDHIAPLPAAHSMRGHGIGAQILRDLGVTRIELLTTSPKSLPGLDAFGIEVSAQRILSV
jgi:3,4-dihydroxy 2-butanone 4-phosphate synthase/GTP cyclohydrolase II